MKHPKQNINSASSLPSRLGAAAALFLAFGLLHVAPAFATYEQVSDFATDSGNHQLFNARGLAVNVNGSGGVPAGTVYAVSGNDARTIRYDAKGEFREEWGWGVADGNAEFERCGPDGEVTHPTCVVETGNVGIWGEGKGQFNTPVGVAVDQATGYVYVLDSGRKHDSIQVFSPDGSQLIASFGEYGDESDEAPEKFHVTNPSGIAVDDNGNVYVTDYKNLAPFHSRVMVFEPQSPGDYEHYVYAGPNSDIADSNKGVNYRPGVLSLDFSGNLFISREEQVYEFSLSEPNSPICKYQIPGGGGEGMTVNPANDEVFYFTFKNKKIHQLRCNSQGVFEETTSFTPLPKTSNIEALAFNPTLAWEPSRPAGVLYAADATEHSEEGEPHFTGIGHIFAPAEVRTPSVESESVSSVTASTATLGARINPKGWQTRYAFQYITDAAYQENEPAEHFLGAIEAPIGGAVLGTGQSPLSAGTSLVGLEPDTEYQFRVIATSHCNPENEEELCESIGIAQTFHTFPVEASGLPDNRAYELVSPAQKNGGEVIPAYPSIGSCFECKPASYAGGEGFPMQSAPDGEAVVYEGFPFSFTEGAKGFNEYLSRRTFSGWQTTILAPPLMTGRYRTFDAELTRGLIDQELPALTLEAPTEYPNLYTQPTGAPSTLTPLVGHEPPNRPPGLSFKLIFAGASVDFSRLFFEANDALTGETSFAPEAVDGGQDKNNLYEAVDGQLRLVNVLPGNTETVPGAEFGAGTQLAPKVDIKVSNFSHAISDDGSRVFWSDEAGQVYVREDGERTMEISDHEGKFLTASADGSKVLLSDGHLFDLGDEEPTADLSQGKGGFEGILGQSEDLSHIYFVDTAVLTGEEENEEGAKAQAGKDNLYTWQEGSSAFVATLLPQDNPASSPPFGDWTASLAQRTAEASPNGRWVAFISTAPLTGYDNIGPSCSPNSVGKFESGQCQEAFLYDSASGELTCPSCNPSGQRPLGWTHLGLIQNAKGSLPQPHYLTDEGRLYFDSRDSLTPFDTNDGVEDVYQYEPEGVGSCKREAGCVSLISAGHEPVDSNFLAADESGKNVFFTTRDQLVLKDRDDLIDLYDAREGGGIPAETETARGECQGEACQPPVTPPTTQPLAPRASRVPATWSSRKPGESTANTGTSTPRSTTASEPPSTTREGPDD